jgi:hypothetical protein
LPPGLTLSAAGFGGLAMKNPFGGSIPEAGRTGETAGTAGWIPRDPSGMDAHGHGPG